MHRFREGQKCIVRSKNPESSLNGEIVTLATPLVRGVNKLKCRVTGELKIYKIKKAAWRTHEVLGSKSRSGATIETVFAETSLIPYDPPSEYTQQSLMEELMCCSKAD